MAFKKIKPTPIERVMAYRLLEHGHSFFWQYKIDIQGKANGRDYFVCDFKLDSSDHVMIETEGKVHVNEENWRKDRTKSNFLQSLGYSVYRFDWDEVMFSDENYDIMIFLESYK